MKQIYPKGINVDSRGPSEYGGSRAESRPWSHGSPGGQAPYLQGPAPGGLGGERTAIHEELRGRSWEVLQSSQVIVKLVVVLMSTTVSFIGSIDRCLSTIDTKRGIKEHLLEIWIVRASRFTEARSQASRAPQRALCQDISQNIFRGATVTPLLVPNP